MATTSLASQIAWALKDRATHDELPALMHDATGLTLPPLREADNETNPSKRDRVLAVLENKTERELAEAARRAGVHIRDFSLEEAGLEILERNDAPITEITRRDVAKCFGDDLTGNRPLLNHLDTLYRLDNMYVGRDVFVSVRLLDLIERHMVRHPGDWSVEELFENLGALKCSRGRFCRLIEGGLHPLARRGPEQTALADAINVHLRRDGYEARPTGMESGYPVYQVLPLGRGVAGTPKNLIFASKGPKPEIGFSDAINNDIVVLSHSESCLIYERAIGTDGLLWADLVDWWKAHPECELPDAAASLGKRLQKSLDSDAEHNLFGTYFRLFKSKLGPRLPALIPQVYLHYDPAIVSRLRYRNSFPRQRMDFLLLLPNNVRIVIEVDGSHHFSEDERPSLTTYAKMVSADRDLRLMGYEVYRFGANELVGQEAPDRIEKFIARLWERHRVSQI